MKTPFLATIKHTNYIVYVYKVKKGKGYAIILKDNHRGDNPGDVIADDKIKLKLEHYTPYNGEVILKNPEPNYRELFSIEFDRVKQIPEFQDIKVSLKAIMECSIGLKYYSIKVYGNVVSLYGGGSTQKEMWQDITEKLKLIK